MAPWKIILDPGAGHMKLLEYVMNQLMGGYKYSTSILKKKKNGCTKWKINIFEKKFKDYADLGKFKEDID